MSDIKDQSVVDYAIAALRDGIRDQLFAPGQRLIIGDVCRQLGVSAGPVREAIRRLTGEGLIIFEPNKGARVRHFDVADIREIFDVRVAVESRAAELAARRIGEGDNCARLTALIAEGPVAVETGGEAYVAHNARFHALIYDLAGNARLAEIAHALTLPLYRLQLHTRIARGASENSQRDHDSIAEAILAGDADAARRAMANHVEQSGRLMAESMERHTPVRPGRRLKPAGE